MLFQKILYWKRQIATTFLLHCYSPLLPLLSSRQVSSIAAFPSSRPNLSSSFLHLVQLTGSPFGRPLCPDLALLQTITRVSAMRVYPSPRQSVTSQELCGGDSGPNQSPLSFPLRSKLKPFLIFLAGEGGRSHYATQGS